MLIHVRRRIDKRTSSLQIRPEWPSRVQRIAIAMPEWPGVAGFRRCPFRRSSVSPLPKPSRPHESHTPRTRVALYVRVSSVAQVTEGFSLEAQDRLCRTFAAQRGWEVVSVYSEPGVSAKDTNRPAFQQMLRDARAGQFNLILTHKLDRFSRSLLDVLVHLNQLESWGVSYVSASEPFDFTTPIGKVQLAILAAFAQWYLDNLSQEIAKGKGARAKAGYWNGLVPFGYRQVDARTIRVDAREARGVRLAFRLYASGAASYGEVADALNRAGHRPRRHALRFTAYKVRDLLQNRFYLGEVKLRKLPGRDRYEYGLGRHPALIDVALWEAAQQVRATNARRPVSRKRGDRVYPLTGLVICADCGRSLRGQSSRQNRYYRDPGSHPRSAGATSLIRADDLEAQVLDCLRARPVPDSLRWESRERADPGQEDGERDRQRARLERQMTRLAQLYQWGDLSQAAYRRQQSALSRQIADVKTQGLANGSLPPRTDDPADLGTWLRTLSAHERQRLYRRLLTAVVVRDGRVIDVQVRADASGVPEPLDPAPA